MGVARRKQDRRLAVFEDTYSMWTERRLTQAQAAEVLGVCERTFRRWVERYREEESEGGGVEALRDRRVSRASHLAAPVDEVMRMVDEYRTRYCGWNVRHYYTRYRRGGGERSYNWVRTKLQEAGAVPRGKGRGKHRKRREPAPCAGMMLHQDGSTHEWTPGVKWDLIVTMDDATNEHYSMFFCEEEGLWSSFQGMREVIASRGLCCSLYTDRGSHYWTTPEAGGKVDKERLTQFGRAMMRDLGIDMIPAYSPEARGRSERAFRRLQDRLVKELAAAGITEMAAANRYVRKTCLPAFNAEFARPPKEDRAAFVPLGAAADLDAILCELHERAVGRDNCVQFEGLKLQLPSDRHRPHYRKARVKVRRHMDGRLSVWHGPRLLGRYAADGQYLAEALADAA